MKKTIILFVTAAALLFSNAVMAEKLAFTEFGLSYGGVIDPFNMSDNNSGVFDTVVFDAKAGIEIIKWVNVYAGAAFHFYMEKPEWGQHYTFFPVFGGIKINIMPEWIVSPSVLCEFRKPAPGNRADNRRRQAVDSYILQFWTGSKLEHNGYFSTLSYNRAAVILK
jgi:hypothetical protein